MEDLQVDKTYEIVINTYGLELEKLKNYKIEFKSTKHSIIEITNKLITYDNEIFDFKIWKNESIQIPFIVKLIHNYTNEIIIDLSEDISNRFNVEFCVERETSIYPTLKIEYSPNKYYECETYFNDLNISRILLLNTSLDFKIYLKDKMVTIIQNKINIISNLSKTKMIIQKKEKETKKVINKKEKEKNKIIKFDKDYSLLGKKRKKYLAEIQDKHEKKLEFSIKIMDSIVSKNLLFSIYFFDFNNMTIAITENDEIINNNKISSIITNKQLQELYSDINGKINDLLQKLEGEDLNQFKEDLLKLLKDYKYDTDAITNNFESQEDEYLLSMEFFYKFIICSQRNTIKEIIEKVFLNYKDPTPERKAFVKKVIKYILLKFKQFKEYIDYINDKNNNKFQKNLIIKKDNLSLHEKIEIYSILLTIILSSPIYYEDTKIEFFDINYNDKNIYLSTYNLLNKIIDQLQPNSNYLKGLRQTFSKIKKDLNQLNYVDEKENKDTFVIEMISLEELKEKIKSFLPKRIIRFVNSRSFTNALYDIVSGDIIINEIIYKSRGNDYLINNNDNNIFDSLDPFIKGNIDFNNTLEKYYYNFYIFQALWRINHESLGHKAVAKINNNKSETPTKYIFNGVFKKIDDAGCILESFIFEDKDEFNSLKNQIFDAEILLNEKFFVENNFNQFWGNFRKLAKENKEKIETEEDYIKQLYLHIYDIYDDNLNLKIEKYIRQKNRTMPQKKCKKFFKI